RGALPRQSTRRRSMLSPRERFKDADIDTFTRELLRAARPTRPMPPTNRARGAHRVARLAAAPLVGLGVSLWSKGVAAAFGLGFASAMTLVVVSPAVRARLGVAAQYHAPEAPRASERKENVAPPPLPTSNVVPLPSARQLPAVQSAESKPRLTTKRA